jgi:glutamate N-acetyltransferase/amino-acid N-acetyltransferase
MENNIAPVPLGGITSPLGFQAGAISANIKAGTGSALDLGILLSEIPSAAAAMFTTNRVKAAPVLWSRERLKEGQAQAVVVNSGCANAFTGEEGLKDAAKMAGLAARKTGLKLDDVLVSSTGLIGARLPMEQVKDGIERITLSRDGGHKLARAIMTTDTVSKETALTCRAKDSRFTIGGMAKGSGMIHPNLATLLCFLTTDANIERDFLRQALKGAVDVSFNMVSIDGDTSPNDMVLIMANGLSNCEPILEGTEKARIFKQALLETCTSLVKEVARDGEGATKLIEVEVTGAPSVAEARKAARTIVVSPLVKAAIHGSDPNWGRIVTALGYSGVDFEPDKIELIIGDICLVKDGHQLPFDKKEIARMLDWPEVKINLKLNLGAARATAWGCDLSEEYVTINSRYTT